MLKLYGQRLDLRADSVRGFAISLNVRLERPEKVEVGCLTVRGFPVFSENTQHEVFTQHVWPLGLCEGCLLPLGVHPFPAMPWPSTL